MEFIINWAKNIVYLMILVRIITSIVPNSSMEKYIKVIAGVIIIIVLINPFLSIDDKENELVNYINSYSLKLNKDEFINNTNSYDNVNEELALKLYKSDIESKIRTLVEQENLYLQDIELKIEEDKSNENYGKILEMNLDISSEENTENDNTIKIDTVNLGTDQNINKSSQNIIIEKKLKNKLINFYNLSSDNININVEDY